MIFDTYELKDEYFKIENHNNCIYPIKPKFFKYPEIFYVVDTEDDSKGNLELIVLKSNKGKTKIFRDNNSLRLREDFKRYIVENEEIKLIYAHNLSYDLNNLFGTDYLNHTPVFRNGSCLQIKFRNNKREVIFRDSVSILRASIKKLGDNFNLPKLHPENGNFNDIDYCIRDCDILIKALTEFFNFLKSNKIPLKLTLPSIFYNYWRSTIKARIYKSDYIDFVKCAYYGGMVECFKLGIYENVNIYDINSLYPFIMKDSIFPETSYAIRENKIRNSKDCFQVLLCTVKQNDYLPILPVRYNSKLIFPNGILRGIWSNLELEYMVKNNIGEIIDIENGLSFYWKSKIFEKAIDKLYNLRINSKYDHEKLFIKIIMNGGYGKFAQTNKFEIFDIKEKIIKQELKEYPPQSNYIWSILISAKARMYLHKFMRMYSNDLIYVDTDSIHLHAKKLDEKYINENLGFFKFEGNFIGTYKGAKCYKLENESEIIYKVKGVPKKNQKEFFEYGKTEFMQPTKMKSYLRKRNSEILNFWKTIVKEYKSEYDKRIVLDDNSTKPLQLDYYTILEEQKAKFEKMGANKIKLDRNRCRVCGKFISVFEFFCELHNPENFRVY